MSPLTLAVLSAALSPLGGIDLPLRTLETLHPSPAGQHQIWFRDYAEACRVAKLQRHMLLVDFRPAGPELAQTPAVFQQEPCCNQLPGYTLARLGTDAVIKQEGKDVRLLEHPAFAELGGQPGLAIIDFAHDEPQLHGQVVSVLPTAYMAQGGEARSTHVLLGLPKGTLTQRTMIYAVRMHPEAPASTSGLADPVLLEEASQHAQYQADIRVQGHHHWDRRFQRIIGRLGGRGAPVEVCAESWPGQGLLASAVECVRCWRLSSGHWSAVRASHSHFGYDMRRGANGIWYGTGIFATLRR